MLRPMNDWEKDLRVLCDSLPPCGDLATHCDSETTDYPLFLCTAHAFEHAMTNGGMVQTGPLGQWAMTLLAGPGDPTLVSP
jgi:hypothetical protein